MNSNKINNNSNNLTLRKNWSLEALELSFKGTGHLNERKHKAE